MPVCFQVVFEVMVVSFGSLVNRWHKEILSEMLSVFGPKISTVKSFV